MTLSNASARRIDRLLAVELLLAVSALAWLTGDTWARPWIWGAGALGLGGLALLLWRKPGSWWTASLLLAGLSGAVLALGLRWQWQAEVVWLMALTLAQASLYQRWPLPLGCGLVFAGALAVAGGAAPVPVWPSALLCLLFTAMAVQATRVRAAQHQGLFDVSFLVRAMGRSGPIRLDLDVVRAETELGQRLRDVQVRVAQVLLQVRQTVQAAQDAAATLQGNSAELSTRTQAGGHELSHSALALEQIAVIVKDSADAAMAARQTAQVATSLAEEGGGIVGQMVGQMQAIDAGARRITDIIGVINGIAFQTNLLALNAAVEAARAGESGRGFAVVAAEVRMLAQRVTQAATEVKAVIDEAVQATTQGNQLAQQAGQTMARLTSAVQQVDSTFHSLSADTAEHAAGLQTMRDAMYQLRDANAHNLRLAEQAQQVAQALNQRSTQLEGLLENFRLSGDVPQPVATVAAAVAPAVPGQGPAALAPTPAPVSAPTPAPVSAPTQAVEFF